VQVASLVYEQFSIRTHWGGGVTLFFVVDQMIKTKLILFLSTFFSILRHDANLDSFRWKFWKKMDLVDQVAENGNYWRFLFKAYTSLHDVGKFV
jgi:hypothetical protein